MIIQHLQVTITPTNFNRNIRDIRVEVIVDGVTYSTVVYADPDDFVSKFDFCIDEARRAILKLVKK